MLIMHNQYQEDDIYNEAARRVGQGDIVSGKKIVKTYTEKTLKEITKLKSKYIPVSIFLGFALSFSIFAYIDHLTENRFKNISSPYFVVVILFLLIMVFISFNFGRVAQYLFPLSKRLLSEHRNIPPVIESLFDDLRNGSWEASIGGKQMPSYPLDSPWRMLLVGGADVRERRHELWCLFGDKLSGDIRVRKIPSGQYPTDRPDIGSIHVQKGMQETTEIALEDVALEGHGTHSDTDTAIESSAYAAELIQGSDIVTREGRLLEEFRSIFPEQCNDLIESLRGLHLTRQLKRSRKWPGENREKWLIIFQTCHEVAKITENGGSVGSRLIADCVAALSQAKAENRINEMGLNTDSQSTEWVKGFVHNEKNYGWIYEGIIRFNGSREIK
ncbi:hypothetical protein HW511_14240 [Asaia siamensis]|nr:hypothetical protein [Asaia siamensis]